MMMESPLISVSGVTVAYGKKLVLANIFMDIKPGKIYGIIGPNGAGKSTLFNAILGLTEISSGSVNFFGDSLEKYRKQVVYLPQKSSIDWNFPATVLDIVLMGRYPHKRLFSRLNKKDRALAFQAMAQLDIEDLADRQIGELSGGQQQRVFLARALCQEAQIFFLDEPFVGVDATTEEKIISTLKDLCKTGKTILVVHHDLSTVKMYFDDIILLNQRLVAMGPTETYFTPDNIQQTYSSQSNILHQTGIPEVS
jgi:ABC-type Mn2+/Zn2+ transport system ATPase subunit